MPLDRYFDKFPKVTYSNSQVVDITKRIIILNPIDKNKFVY